MSLETLNDQAKLIELGQNLLIKQPSISPIFNYSGYSGIFIEKFLEAHLKDTQLVVKCEFPIDDDADTNIGYIFISLDDEKKFVAEF